MARPPIDPASTLARLDGTLALQLGADKISFRSPGGDFYVSGKALAAGFRGNEPTASALSLTAWGIKL